MEEKWMRDDDIQRKEQCNKKDGISDGL